MKKTVSVNIKGMNFLIEEDAYELLQDYIDRLKHGLRNEQGSKEIVEDIELRIAELCSSILNEKKQVIEIEDIESILATLGDPKQYIDEDGDSSQDYVKESKEFTSAKSKEKRLFRDIDNASIAGICAGIANFFNIDVVIIRAIFVVMFFFGGFGFPLYIILWIIVPKANSTIDKLRMRGIPITVDTVREEVESAAERLTKGSKNFMTKMRSDDSHHQRFSSIGRVITVIFGGWLIAVGLFFLVMFLIFGIGGMQFIPVQSDNGLLSFAEFGELVLKDDSDYSWSWIGGLLTGFSVILFILLLGVKVLFRIRNRWSRISLLMLFISGFIGTTICIFIAAKTGREMALPGDHEVKIGSVNTAQLILIPHHSTNEYIYNSRVKSRGNFGLIGLQGDKIIETGIHIEYKLSQDSLYHIHQNLSANGYTRKQARQMARNIKHTIYLDSSKVHVNTFYRFPKKDKLRDQEVYIIIEIPKGKTVKINNQIIRLGSENLKENELDEYYQEQGILENDGEYEHFD